MSMCSEECRTKADPSLSLHRSPVDRSQRVRLNEKIYNAVRICDPEKNGKAHPIKANANIPDNYTRVLDVTDQINDLKQNVIDQSVGDGGLMMAYAQSFLREEVGKMYRGELVLRRIPEIEPADVWLIIRSPRPAQLQKPRAGAGEIRAGFFCFQSSWAGRAALDPPVVRSSVVRCQCSMPIC